MGVACCGTLPAQAAEVVVGGSVLPGALNVSYPSAQLRVALRSAAHRVRRVAFVLPFDVRDSRGSGAGWAITLSSAELRFGPTLPRVFVTGAQVACGKCTLPRNRVRYPVVISRRGAPVRVFAARRRTGMGSMRVWIDGALALPAGVQRGPVRLVFSQTAGP